MAVDPGGTSSTTLRGRDPGGSGATGVVIFEPIGRLEIDVLMWREVPDRLDFLDWADMQRKIGGVTHCVCENYTPRPGIRTWEPDPIYIIGALEWRFRPEHFDLQMVGNAKQWGTDAKIRPYIQGDNAVGRNGDGHALMALRHALLWTSNRWDGT